MLAPILAATDLIHSGRRGVIPSDPRLRQTTLPFDLQPMRRAVVTSRQ